MVEYIDGNGRRLRPVTILIDYEVHARAKAAGIRFGATLEQALTERLSEVRYG
ncbi:hypothetical protein DSECCO2_413030 [anaerobic digester metagenome]